MRAARARENNPPAHRPTRAPMAADSGGRSHLLALAPGNLVLQAAGGGSTIFGLASSPGHAKHLYPVRQAARSPCAHILLVRRLALFCSQCDLDVCPVLASTLPPAPLSGVRLLCTAYRFPYRARPCSRTVPIFYTFRARLKCMRWPLSKRSV